MPKEGVRGGCHQTDAEVVHGPHPIYVSIDEHGGPPPHTGGTWNGNMDGTQAVEAAPNQFRWNWMSLRPCASQACLRIHSARQNLPLAIDVRGRDTASRAETLEHRHPQMTKNGVPRTLVLMSRRGRPWTSIGQPPRFLRWCQPLPVALEGGAPCATKERTPGGSGTATKEATPWGRGLLERLPLICLDGRHPPRICTASTRC
jgi:hypothetical protein